MTVHECKIDRESRRVVETNSKRTYFIQFKIRADESDWQPQVIVGSREVGPNPVPRINDLWKYGGIDTTAICKEVEFSQDEPNDAGHWIATAEFGQPESGNTPEDEDENPLRRRARFSVQSIDELIPVAEDNGLDNGGTPKPLRNSAGDEFIDPIQIENHSPVLVIQKNIGNIQSIIDWNLEYNQSTNSSSFRNGDPRTVKFVPIRVGDEQFENGILYYPATFAFAYKADTWDEAIVNQGYYHLDGGDRKRAKDADGEDSVSPVLLETDGSLTPQGQIGNTLKFRVRPERDFNTLAREAGF